MELKTYFAQDASGNIMPGANVVVYLAGTATLATGLEDENGDPLANPFTADANAKVAFYAPDGLYDLVVSSLGRTVSMRIQFADYDASTILRTDLATNASGKGANIVAAGDGAGGSLWTTVQGAITYLISSIGSSIVGFIQSGIGAVLRTVQQELRERVTLAQFGAIEDGVADDTAAVEKAIVYATSRSVLGTPVYVDILLKAGGRAKITHKVNLPGEGSFRFVGQGHIYYASAFVQGYAGHLFGCASGNLTTRFYNLVLQGDKTTYPGDYSAIQTEQDAVHAGFEKVVARDFGGVAIDLANCFDCVFDDLVVAYNKGGGLRTTGGASNKFGLICTQNNLGFGLEIGGGGNSGGPFFLEGDLADNDPDGADLDNRALKITGADNVFFGGTLLTHEDNDKTPVEITGERNIWLGVSAASKGTATHWVLLGDGANNCRVGGGLQTAITGNAAAINTCVNDLSGPAYPLVNGEMLFSRGSASSSAGNGLHVGFDAANNRGYVRATDPGVTNRPLDLQAASIVFRGAMGTSESETAATLGTVVRKIAVVNEAGGIIGYLPLYNEIT